MGYSFFAFIVQGFLQINYHTIIPSCKYLYTGTLTYDSYRF